MRHIIGSWIGGAGPGAYISASMGNSPMNQPSMRSTGESAGGASKTTSSPCQRRSPTSDIFTAQALRGAKSAYSISRRAWFRGSLAMIEI